MLIAGVQKVTLLDYPGHIACEIFTKGCNFKCPFCQNSSLIPLDGGENYSEEELFNYLKRRKKVLDGVVITGGEPLIHKDVPLFIEKIKQLGLLVKLDTNGSNPEMLEFLLTHQLVDYVAMDIKNVFSKYFMTAGKKVNLENIKRSIEIIKRSGVAHEFRTTIIKEMHRLEDIRNICELIGDDVYYLQNFEDSCDVINHELHGFSYEELLFIYGELKDRFPKMQIRTL